MSTCNWLDLQTLGSQPIIPRDLPITSIQGTSVPVVSSQPFIYDPHELSCNHWMITQGYHITLVVTHENVTYFFMGGRKGGSKYSFVSEL